MRFLSACFLCLCGERTLPKLLRRVLGLAQLRVDQRDKLRFAWPTRTGLALGGAFELRREAGAGQFFVQQYVKHGGHCNITPSEVEHGFTELLAWKRNGKAPKAGWLRVGSEPPGHKKPEKKAIKKPAKKH